MEIIVCTCNKSPCECQGTRHLIENGFVCTKIELGGMGRKYLYFDEATQVTKEASNIPQGLIPAKQERPAKACSECGTPVVRGIVKGKCYKCYMRLYQREVRGEPKTGQRARLVPNLPAPTPPSTPGKATKPNKLTRRKRHA